MLMNYEIQREVVFPELTHLLELNEDVEAHERI